MRKWLCVVCGLIYDEAKGWPDDGIMAGTRWEDVPDDWLCPDCGVGKADFEMIEITESPVATSSVAESVSDAPIAAVLNDEPPVVIVGSGFAGYTLAETLREKSPQKPIIVFTSDDGANYSKPGLSNALTRGKSAAQLVTETALQIEKRLNIRIYTRVQVERIDADAHLLHTDIGEQAYSKLILATGAAPIRLPLAGSGAADVLSVNDLGDYRVMRAQLEGAKKVCIIGNGLIGCEFANDLSNQGLNVTVVGLGDWAMQGLIPQQVGEQLQSKLAEQGVNWQLQDSVEIVDQADSGYLLTLTSGVKVEADLVISAVGLKPRTELAQTAGIDCNRGVKVNGGLRTNVADVYALGDCAELQGKVLPYIAPINFGVRALADCLLGRPTMAQYPYMPVVVKTPALPLTIQSPEVGSEGDWQTETTDDGMRSLFRDSAGMLKGFVLAGSCTSERQQWLDQLI
nr:FAD-dependent oxidoreductase [Aliamphritea ceti]